jgi:hypothetical protein
MCVQFVSVGLVTAQMAPLWWISAVFLPADVYLDMFDSESDSSAGDLSR